VARRLPNDAIYCLRCGKRQLPESHAQAGGPASQSLKYEECNVTLETVPESFFGSGSGYYLVASTYGVTGRKEIYRSKRFSVYHDYDIKTNPKFRKNLDALITSFSGQGWELTGTRTVCRGALSSVQLPTFRRPE